MEKYKSSHALWLTIFTVVFLGLMVPTNIASACNCNHGKHHSKRVYHRYSHHRHYRCNDCYYRERTCLDGCDNGCCLDIQYYDSVYESGDSQCWVPGHHTRCGGYIPGHWVC